MSGSTTEVVYLSLITYIDSYTTYLYLLVLYLYILIILIRVLILNSLNKLTL